MFSCIRGDTLIGLGRLVVGGALALECNRFDELCCRIRSVAV